MRLSALQRARLAVLAPLISLFLISTTTEAGVLELVDREPDADLRFPQAIAISPDDRYLYLGSNQQTTQFARDSVSGELTFIAVGPGDGSIAMSGDGRGYFASHFLGLDARRRDVVSGDQTLVESWEGPPILDRLYPEKVWLSPDDRHLYVGTHDALVVFAVDPATHALTWVQSLFDGFGGIRGLEPSHGLAFGPGGDTVYVSGAELDGFGGYMNATLLAMSRDPSTGELALEQILDGEGLDRVAVAADVWASPDGGYVYAVGVGGLVVFERDPASGSLSFLQVEGTGGNEFAASPDGKFFYVFHNDDIEIFSRHEGSGRVDLVHSGELEVESIWRVTAAQVSLDSRFLYLASSNHFPYLGGLSVYSRDLETGQLQLVETHFDDPQGDAEVTETQSVVVSPDGRHVYVGGRRGTFSVSAFSPFSRWASRNRR